MLILILIFMDIITKSIIQNHFMDKSLLFLNNKIGFLPYLNEKKLSIYNLKFGMNLSMTSLLIINIILFTLILVTYIIITINKKKTFHINNIMSFLIAGAACSIIDKLFFHGSLDFIKIGKHIHDFKDIYIYIFCAYALIYTLLNIDLKSTNKNNI